MAISINWVTRVINVPRLDLQLVQTVPTEIRQLNLDAFRLELKDIEDDEGMPFDTTHSHNTAVTVGGVTLARVIEIINGYSVTFEDGQYAVNLVGANSNVADVTNVNQVSVRSANSAGLTFSETINDQSYTNNRVYINTAGDGQPGVSFPRGTPTDPVDTYTDAVIIAENRKLHDFDLDGTLVFGGGNNLYNTNWYGTTPIDTILVFSGQNIEKATFERIGITGLVMGRASYNTCAFANVVNFSGIAENCGFNGNITLDPGSTTNILFANCMSVIAGTAKPILDCNGTNSDIHIRGYIGGLKITNFTAGNNMSADVIAGRIEIDSTCTSGTIVIGGTVEIIDNSAPGCTVILNSTTARLVDEAMNSNTLLLDIENHAHILDFNTKISIDATNGTSGTTYPIGTSGTPAISVGDALTISNNIAIDTFDIAGTINFSDPIPGYTFVGKTILSSILVLNGQDTTETIFKNLLITGALNGKVLLQNAAIGNILGFTGHAQRSMIVGSIQLNNVITSNILFNDCYSLMTDDLFPVLDCNFTPADIQFRKYTGDLKITNFNYGNNLSVDVTSGRIEIDSSCVAGTIIIRGELSQLVDNSAAGCTVINLSTNNVLLDANVNDYQNVDSIGATLLNAEIQAALAAALSA